MLFDQHIELTDDCGWQVQTIYVHPKYNSTNYLDDLAVLILSSPAEFTKYVRPVCLWPRHNFNLQNIDNKEGTVSIELAAWGADFQKC